MSEYIHRSQKISITDVEGTESLTIEGVAVRIDRVGAQYATRTHAYEPQNSVLEAAKLYVERLDPAAGPNLVKENTFSDFTQSNPLKADVRKDLMRLDDTELAALGRALNGVYNADPNIIETYANLHATFFNNGIHWGPAFLPWHRDFLRKFELHLQRIEPGVTLPYWDWTRADSRSLGEEPWLSFFGGRANDKGLFNAWRYRRSEAVGTLPTSEQVAAELDQTSFTEFRGIESGSHVNPHVWVGGDMSSGHSPRDPLFFLHHCNLDRLWAQWQSANPDLTQYSSTGVVQGDRVPAARVALDDEMVAVDGSGATPRSMLNHRALGYEYDNG